MSPLKHPTGKGNHPAEGRRDVLRKKQLIHCICFWPGPSNKIRCLPIQSLKIPPNSHVKPPAPKNQHNKIHNPPKMNDLQLKNKSAQSGILVTPNSIE